MSNSVQLGGIYEDGYGIVPKKMFKAKNIGKNEKLILSYFLSYTGAGKDSCFPSIDLISEDLGLSRGTIVEAIKVCVSEGFIRKEKLHPDNPLNHANKYVILFSNSDSSMVRTSIDKTTDGSTFRTTIVQPLDANNNNINNNTINNSSGDGVPSPSPSSLNRQEDMSKTKKNPTKVDNEDKEQSPPSGKDLLSHFYTEYKRVYGRENEYKASKADYIQSARIVKSYGIKSISALTQYMNDAWAKDNGGHRFLSFVKNIDRWINAIPKEAKREKVENFMMS